MADATSSLPKVTAPSIRQMKGVRKVAMVTAYDATFARLCDESGIDAILVGDSLGMVIQGLDNTLPVTVDEMVYHCHAVSRGARRAQLVGDLPFMSYQVSLEEGLRNAGRLVKEGGAEAVKLEGGQEYAELIARLSRIGIPVMGHLGLTPQSVHQMGGFKVQGRDAAVAARLLEDATALDQAGVYAMVLEGIPRDLAEEITASVSCPTIGIGAGVSCDGQVLVSYDLLGLNDQFRPRFVKRYDHLALRVRTAMQGYVNDVRSGQFPDDDHSFGGHDPAGLAQSAPYGSAAHGSK